MLEVKNLAVSIENKEILKSINLKVMPGETHVIMGPNGSGKSTLASVLMGKPDIKIKSGNILIDSKDLKDLDPSERAKRGLFLAFQYPIEISGVPIESFLRVAYQNITGKKIPPIKFRKILEEKMKILGIDKSFSLRSLNEGFSGGEKKKAEILQMAVLNPKYAILDETDSGLDISALKTVFSSIKRIKSKNTALIVITHYKRVLDYLNPNYIHILINGKIVESGGQELADEVEKDGYGKFML